MLLLKATFTKTITFQKVCELLLILEFMFIRSTGAIVTPNVWYEHQLVVCGLQLNSPQGDVPQRREIPKCVQIQS
jgi:hypothetical protein